MKDVNTALSYAQRKSVPMYQKNDGYDAEAVALVLINMLDKLPDVVPDDAYWTLSQLVNRRDNICSHQQRLKNQLHEQLCVAYPSYKQFFGDIGWATALYFWLNYPSPEHLWGKTAEELAAELRPISHNNCSIKRAEKILELVRTDGQITREHGEEVGAEDIDQYVRKAEGFSPNLRGASKSHPDNDLQSMKWDRLKKTRTVIIT